MGNPSPPGAAPSLHIVKGGRGGAIIARWEGPWLETDYYPYRERVVEGKTHRQLVVVAPVLAGDDPVVDFF